MADGIELAYSLSAKDRINAQADIDRLAQKRDNSAVFGRAQPYVVPVVKVFLAYVAIHWLINVLPGGFAGIRADPFRPAEIPGHLVGAYATWYSVTTVWQFASRNWGREKAKWAGRDGVNAGGHRLSATPAALTIHRAARTTQYAWAAFSGLHRTRRMLLLMLTPKQAVAIPRRAFKSEADEHTFREFVARQISAA